MREPPSPVPAPLSHVMLDVLAACRADFYSLPETVFAWRSMLLTRSFADLHDRVRLARVYSFLICVGTYVAWGAHLQILDKRYFCEKDGGRRRGFNVDLHREQCRDRPLLLISMDTQQAGTSDLPAKLYRRYSIHPDRRRNPFVPRLAY